MSVEMQDRPVSPEQTPQQLQIDVVTRSEAPKKGIFYKVGVVTVAGIATLGALNYAKNHMPALGDFIPDISNPFADAGNNPPDVDASVRKDTIEIEEKQKVKCSGTIGAAIEVNGNKDELMGSGEYSKLLFGDFKPCADEIPMDVVLTKDNSDGTVINVKATTNGLMVTQPRVDNTDFRNCVSLRPGDSKKEIDQKIKQWKQDEKADKEKCDNGFEIGGWWVVGGDASKVITTGHTGAQIALASYVPGKELVTMNKEFRADLKADLELRYPNAEVTVSMADIKQRTRAQARQVIDNLKDNTYRVKIDNEDGKKVMNVSAPGAGEVSVKVQDIFAGAVKIVSVQGEVGERTPVNSGK